jgi:hypothetical protein
MMALARLRATRAALAGAVLVRAVLWAMVAGLGFQLAGARIGHGAIGPWLAPLAALCVLAAVLWRGRAAASLAATALWVEERRPALRYALVTLADPRAGGDRAALGATVETVRWGGAVAKRLARSLAVPTAALMVVLLAGEWIPRSVAAGAPAPGRGAAEGGGAERGAGAAGLGVIHVRITPPAYTGESPRDLRDPETVDALPGSRIALRGSGDGPPNARLGDAAVRVTRRDTGWGAELAMPAEPGLLRLSGARGDRLLVLEPVMDSLPVVTLLAPATDSVLARPAGSLEIRAEARDDWGLDQVRLEWIVSSGQGELFEFRSGVLAEQAPGGGRRANLRTTLHLDSLRLGPGDVVHLRAVARDRNTVTGPGVGVSETRALRVLRVGERDSVAVDAPPPAEAEQAVLSQRMLIQLAERLEGRRPRLERATVVAESRSIAVEQVRLRRQVGDIVFMRHGEGEGGEHAHGPGGHVHYHGDGHDHAGEDLPTAEELLRRAEAATEIAAGHDHGGESPVVALNRPLLRAYNHMWNAAGELEVGEPGAALPHMRFALEAINEAREAERRYLRGGMPLVIVDLERVRLAAARTDVTPAGREGATIRDDAARRRLSRLDRAIALLRDEPDAAADSMRVLRVDLLADAPAAARSLGDAIGRLRTGTDATDALIHARRTLAGPPELRPGLGRWEGI